MTARRASIALGLLAATAFAEGDAPPAPLLTAATYDAVREAVLPKPSELEWKTIGWRPAFWDAVTEAQRDEKPILLWAMNGHPCGET